MKTPGQVAYEAVYPKYMGDWDDLGKSAKSHWERVAEVVPKAILEHQQSQQYDELDIPSGHPV